MPETLYALSDKVRPEHTALVLVDVQNDFCAEGGFSHRSYGHVPAMAAVVPRIKTFLAAARRAGAKRVFVLLVRDDKTNSGPFLEVMARNGQKEYACHRGTWGARLVDGIMPRRGEYIVEKHEKSAFIGTNFDILLRNLGVRTIVLCGGATNICLGTTACDAFMLGYYVVVLEDLSRGSNDHLHRAALDNIDRSFGQVVLSKEILNLWKQ